MAHEKLKIFTLENIDEIWVKESDMILNHDENNDRYAFGMPNTISFL